MSFSGNVEGSFEREAGGCMDLQRCRSQELSAGSPHDGSFLLPISHGYLEHSVFPTLCINYLEELSVILWTIFSCEYIGWSQAPALYFLTSGLNQSLEVSVTGVLPSQTLSASIFKIIFLLLLFLLDKRARRFTVLETWLFSHSHLQLGERK